MYWRLSPDGQPARVTFDGVQCAFELPAASVSTGCAFAAGGTFTYRVEGFGPGTGRVEVAPVQWVTLRAPRQTIVFGSPLVLGGTAYQPSSCGPPPTPGARPPAVVVSALRAGQPARRRAAAAIPRSGPVFTNTAWQATVRPGARKSYRARWHGFDSSEVTVDVRPRTVARLVGRRLVRARVVSLRSHRGRWVALHRRARSGGWRFARAVRLGRGSSARFRVGRAGVYRVFVPRSTAGPGYVAGWSRPLRVR